MCVGFLVSLTLQSFLSLFCGVLNVRPCCGTSHVIEVKMLTKKIYGRLKLGCRCKGGYSNHKYKHSILSGKIWWEYILFLVKKSLKLSFPHRHWNWLKKGELFMVWEEKKGKVMRTCFFTSYPSINFSIQTFSTLTQRNFLINLYLRWKYFSTCFWHLFVDLFSNFVGGGIFFVEKRGEAVMKNCHL